MSDKEKVSGEEVVRYEAVHLRYDENNIRYGEGCEVEVVTAADFDRITDALRGEVERLHAEIEEWSGTAVQNGMEVDQLRAELDSIKRMSECGTVHNWLSLPDEDKAKWFALMVGTDSENKQLRAEVERLNEQLTSVQSPVRCKCCGYLVTDREHLGCLRIAGQLAQQQGGEYGDAYQGARDDLAIWKRRALEAEARVRQQDQIIDQMGEDLNAINGPTFMGEPVLPRQQAREVVMPSRAVKDGGKFATELKVTGWNAYLDEFARLNKGGIHE